MSEHKVVIGGVEYAVIGGTVLIGGVAKELGSGTVLMGGVEKEINFPSKEPVVVKITGTGDKNYRYVHINGIKYYAAKTFEFTEMPTISVYLNAIAGSSGWTRVLLNGTIVQRGTGTYTLNTQDRNITIRLSSTYSSSEGITTNIANITTS